MSCAHHLIFFVETLRVGFWQFYRDRRLAVVITASIQSGYISLLNHAKQIKWVS